MWAETIGFYTSLIARETLPHVRVDLGRPTAEVTKILKERPWDLHREFERGLPKAIPSTEFANFVNRDENTFDLPDFYAVGVISGQDSPPKLGFGNRLRTELPRPPSVVFEASISEITAQEGSLKTLAVGAFLWVAADVAKPIILDVFNKASADKAREELRHIAVKSKFETIYGACTVKGSIEVNLGSVLNSLKWSTTHGDPASICEIQLALNSLGFSVGTADGRLGPHTLAAIDAFQRRWNLPSSSFSRGVAKPVFAEALVRALMGQVPP